MIGWPPALSSASPLSVCHFTQRFLKYDTTVLVPAPGASRHLEAPLSGSTVFFFVARSRTFSPGRLTTIVLLSRSAEIHTRTRPVFEPIVVPG